MTYYELTQGTSRSITSQWLEPLDRKVVRVNVAVVVTLCEVLDVFSSTSQDKWPERIREHLEKLYFNAHANGYADGVDDGYEYAQAESQEESV